MEDGGALSFPVNGFLTGESGAIALWIKTIKDPVPTFVPCDLVGLHVSGQNELGKKTDILKIETSSPGNFFRFVSAYGNKGVSFVRPRKIYYGNEWRHFIFTWDKDSGLRVYLDGRLFLSSSGLRGPSRDFFKNLSNIQPEQLQLFTATGDNPREKAYFDELRLFNRALTEDEALALYEEYVSVYPVLLDYAVIAGDKRPYRVRMLHKKDAAPVKVKTIVENLEGKKLFESNLLVSESGHYKVDFHPSKPAVYRMKFIYGGKIIRTFEIIALSGKSITGRMPESVTGKPRLKLLEEINSTDDYPSSRYRDDGEVKVVDSPIGKYRSSTRTKFDFQEPSGFAYNFTVKNPGRPHFLEVEYPNDKPRVFYVVVDQKLDNMGFGKNKFTNTYSLDTIGVAEGVNNPVSGKFVKKRLLFWPDSSQCMIAFFGYKTFPACAGPAMKSIRIYENIGSLPRLKVNTPEAMQERSVGNWNEDGGMPSGCWFNRYINNQGPSFDFWLEKLTRRVEYTRFMGQNQIVIQVFRDGDLTGMTGMFPAQYMAGMMPGWSCLAASIFERENIPFYIQFCNYKDTSILGIDEISSNPLEAAAKGMDSIEMMTADGTLAESSNTLNFLCPPVRDVLIERVRFYRDQFDIYDTFKGILFFRSSNLTFKNEKTGYGDYTISLFEKETGMKIPVGSKGMDRFLKRYNYLKSDKTIWNRWIDWRCAKVREFVLLLSEELNSGKKSDLKIILPLKTETSEISFISDNLKNHPQEIDIVEGFGEMGIDIASLSSETSLILEPVSAPNYSLLYRKGSDQNLDAFWYSDNFADFLRKNKFPALMLSRHANMEIYGCRSSGIEKYWWPRGYWSSNGGFHCFSTAMPDNRYLPQTLAWGLANGDLRHIDHGWWGNPENGAYEQFQKFYQAYRSIPAVTFKKVPGANDPVMVRLYNHPDDKSNWYNPISWFSSGNSSDWFYMVNMQYYKTKVKITFDSDVELKNVVFNSSEELKGRILEIDLEPYQVICFRSGSPLNIMNVEQIVQPDIAAELSGLVDDLTTAAKLAASVKTKMLVQTADKMLEEKRYSALYYLTRSYSAQELLKEAEKPIVFKASMNPDLKTLDIEAINRTPELMSVKLTLNILPQGVSCSEMTKKNILGAKDSILLSFPLAGLDLNNINSHEKLEFEIDVQVISDKIGKLKYTFFPVVGTKAENINIDGDLSDWKNARWNQLVQCAKTIPIQGMEALAPFDSEFATKWNEKGLYLTIRINENDLISTPNGKEPWHYDFIEIMIDQRNDGDSKDNCVFYAANIENAPLRLTLKPSAGQTAEMVSQCRIERQRNGNQTVYEKFIPSTVLNQVSFKPGFNVGFALKLHNREHTNDPSKDLWGYRVSTADYPRDIPDMWNDILFSEKAE